MEPPIGVARPLARFALTLTLFALTLFAPAGTWNWTAAWLYVGLYVAFAIPVGIWLFRTNPALLAQRLDWSRRAPKGWDRALMTALIPVFAAVYVTAGLDHRFGWSQVHRPAQGAAFVLVGGFYVLLALVLRENSFLSRVVEVHPEAGHRVVSTGPYAVVRHPMYAGYLLWTLATPVALGSWPALAPAAVMAAAMLLRTVLEDRTLHAELPGYAEYAARVRWRLLPGVF